jgi:hypothetical protein
MQNSPKTQGVAEVGLLPCPVGKFMRATQLSGDNIEFRHAGRSPLTAVRAVL